MKNLKSFAKVVIPIVFVFIFSISSFAGDTEPVVGLHQNTPNVFALKNAKIITEPGRQLDKATIVVRNDCIESIGTDIEIPPDAVVIDCNGKTIMPGFIDLFSDYGTTVPAAPAAAEAPTVSRRGAAAPAAAPQREGAAYWNSSVIARRQVSDILRTDTSSADTLRRAGFTAALTFARDGIFKGSGALVHLSDKRPNLIIIRDNIGQAVSLSPAGGRGRGYPGSLMGSIALIRQTLLDAQWYNQAQVKYKQSPAGQDAPEKNLDLEALQPYLTAQKPLVMTISDEQDIFRVEKLAKEFGLQTWVVGTGTEYRRLAAIKHTGLKIILPINFPDAPDVSSIERQLNAQLTDLRNWDIAPENPARLEKENVDFVISSTALRSKADFLARLRAAVKRGLTKDGAIKALTTKPAEWTGASQLCGTLEKGKLASFIITDGDIFNDSTVITETWVAGERHIYVRDPQLDIRGRWAFVINIKDKEIKGELRITGQPTRPSASFTIDEKETRAKTITLQERIVQITAPGEIVGAKGEIKIMAAAEEKAITGMGVTVEGDTFSIRAELEEPSRENQRTRAAAGKPEEIKMAEFDVVYPESAFGKTQPPEQPEILLLKNATIWTSGPQGIINPGDLLIRKGKIAQVDKNITAPENATVLDCTGKHISAGMIDDHSHIATTGGVNEGTDAITSECRIEDVIDAESIAIYRELAGGITSTCTIHGSANPIGGTYSVIKLRWGALPEELLIKDAKPGLKMALGENVKRSTGRYPNTRMGTVEIIRDAFDAAADYKKEWQNYLEKSKTNSNLIPPRKILRNEPLVDVLDGRMLIHCHGYRQDELLAMLLLGDELGIKFNTFIHVLEGYKIATEMKKHGAMATTFSDWWYYKVEAADAIPYNGALLYQQGVNVSFNSDDAELARRMNVEAAKAVKYGDVPIEEAWKFVTINPAIHLALENRIGSLETGKDADFVIWSGSPLSTYSICEQTWIDGRKYFDVEEDKKMRERALNQKSTLIQKILAAAKTTPSRGGRGGPGTGRGVTEPNEPQEPVKTVEPNEPVLK